MPTYHIQAITANKTLYRVMADDPRKAVELLYQQQYGEAVPEAMSDDLPDTPEVDVIQWEGTEVEVTHVFDTDFVSYPSEPLRDETAYPQIDVDMTEPAEYNRFHGTL